MASIFSKIVAGEIPCHKIAEDDRFLAFLDVRPQAVGHTLCIPKKEIDYIFDLSDEDLAGLMVFAKRVGLALQKTVPCLRIGIGVIGLEVPHAHVHLIPMNKPADMRFGSTIGPVPEQEMRDLAAAVAANF